MNDNDTVPPLTFSDLFAVVFAVFELVAGLTLTLKPPEGEMQFHGAILAAACAIFFGVLAKISRGYGGDVVKSAVIATILWSIAGVLVGNVVAWQLAFPALNADLPWLSFNRLIPLHISAMIFAFGGNALLATSFYAVQRTCQAQLYGRFAPWFVFIGYNAFVVIAGSAHVLGIGQVGEYNAPVWYAGWWLMLVWAVYLIVFVGTVSRRKEPRIDAANWFFLVFILTVGVGHIVNHTAVPVSLLGSKSHTVDWAMHTFTMEWARSDNIESFILTAGFLGGIFYLLPARTRHPVYSNKLAIAYCLVLCLAYIWIRPFHLYHIVLSDWAQTFGKPFSIVLWALSVAGMLIGLTALRGVWSKLLTDPVMRILVASMVVKAVEMALYYNGVGRSGAGGSLALMIFGALYCLVPWLWKREKLYSTALAEWHLWLSALGILLYADAMWIAGTAQALLWSAYDKFGYLPYSFVENIEALHPYYIIRAIGGALFSLGVLIMGYNLLMTIAAERPVPTSDY